MMTKYCISYHEDGVLKSQYCDNKRDASNFARKVTKDGSTARVYRVNGMLHNGSFYETQSTFVADYKDGKRT
jgi:hypothetical protein